MNEVGTTSEAGPSSVSSGPSSVSSGPSSICSKRVMEHEIIWPKRRKKDEGNKIFAFSIDNWDTVEGVEVGGKRFEFLEKKATSHYLSLAHHQLEIVCPGITLHLPCSPAVQSDLRVYRQSKLVCEEVGMLPDLPAKSAYSITPRKRQEDPNQRTRDRQTLKYSRVSKQTHSYCYSTISMSSGRLIVSLGHMAHTMPLEKRLSCNSVNS